VLAAHLVVTCDPTDAGTRARAPAEVLERTRTFTNRGWVLDLHFVGTVSWYRKTTATSMGPFTQLTERDNLLRQILEDRAMSELLGIARFKFHEGKREEYLRLSDKATDIVRTKDPGTLAYDLYLNGDQSECMVIERYRDSEAAMAHAANLGHLFPAVLATVSVVHGELLGEPSAELRARLAGSEEPALFTPYRSWRPAD
jgi:quinol monooxygenase YgiN